MREHIYLAGRLAEMWSELDHLILREPLFGKYDLPYDLAVIKRISGVYYTSREISTLLHKSVKNGSIGYWLIVNNCILVYFPMIDQENPFQLIAQDTTEANNIMYMLRRKANIMFQPNELEMRTGYPHETEHLIALTKRIQPEVVFLISGEKHFLDGGSV